MSLAYCLYIIIKKKKKKITECGSKRIVTRKKRDKYKKLHSLCESQ